MSASNIGQQQAYPRVSLAGNVYRYTGTALFFLVVVLALPATGVVTQLLLVMKKRGLAWEKFKTYSDLAEGLLELWLTCNLKSGGMLDM